MGFCGGKGSRCRLRIVPKLSCLHSYIVAALPLVLDDQSMVVSRHRRCLSEAKVGVYQESRMINNIDCRKVLLQCNVYRCLRALGNRVVVLEKCVRRFTPKVLRSHGLARSRDGSARGGSAAKPPETSKQSCELNASELAEYKFEIRFIHTHKSGSPGGAKSYLH